MNQKRISSFLRYWQDGNMVNLDEVKTIEDLIECRRFCACMRIGCFHPNNVSTNEIWEALKVMRQEASAS